jgi:type II secretory pathway predicted ATPase ExeA
MSKKLQQLYGLKWNPFSPDVPTEALHVTARLDSFGWRVEQLVREGGFAVILGDPGTGKSVALRLLAARLTTLRDVVVGILTRPHAGLADCYRELGHLFSVSLRPHNRWAGATALRETWRAHIEAARLRPVLLVDEAQDMRTEVRNELRVLASADLDARVILTVVLAGDRRLQARLRELELLPLESRLRVKLLLEAASRDDLAQCLRHVLEQAGNPRLLTPGLLDTLVDHAGGNHRTLMAHAHELLLAGAERERPQLDEQLFFDLFAPAASDRPRPRPTRTR